MEEGFVLAKHSRASADRAIRRGDLIFPSQRFHPNGGDVAIRCLKLTSRTVIGCQPWFYSRLVVYSFFGLSEGAEGPVRISGAQGTQGLTTQVDTHPRTRAS